MTPASRWRTTRRWKGKLVQFNVNPIKLANLLHNAMLLAEVPKGTKGIDLILLEVGEHKLTAMAAGTHTAGAGSIDLSSPNEEGGGSVLITAAEAKELQSTAVLRGTSSAKDAAVVVEISEEGVEYTDSDGTVYTANLVITYADRDLCALPDADPYGESSDHWDILETMLAAAPKEAISMSFNQKAIAVLGKLKPPREFVTFKMGAGRFATAYTEGWRIVIGDQRPDLKALEELSIRR